MRPELASIDVGTMLGLEFGPLISPRIRKEDGPVRYVDMATTEELRAKYLANPQMEPLVDQIVDVDYVVREGERLADVLGPDGPYDYILASHVAEHIPNLIGWLKELSGLLHPGGVLSLIIPDKRYCFDLNRRLTEMSDLVDGLLRDLDEPSFQQIYDFFANVVTIDGSVDTAGLWAGTADYNEVVRSDVNDPHRDAFQHCLDQRDNKVAHEVHCHTFTPDSFLNIYDKLVRLELTDFEIAHFVPTPVNTLEFYVTLRKASTADRSALRSQQVASIPHLSDPAAARHSVQPGASDRNGNLEHSEAVVMTVSLREQRLLSVKRRLFESIRSCMKP